MDYKDLWVVLFPRCTAGPKIVGSCCIRLHTTASTHATTPNIVGATMLGVVATVCTQLALWIHSALELSRTALLSCCPAPLRLREATRWQQTCCFNRQRSLLDLIAHEI